MTQFAAVKETLNALPVAAIAADVVLDTLAHKVTILAAPTGSGKSMIVPAMLADASDEPVYVLVPRRFLATDAAANVAQLAGVKLGEEVGYAIGKKGGDGAKRSKHTKLIFMTYGYAISSGIVGTAQNIVLDEVHERSEDISLVRAMLHERKKHEPSLNILEMSATVNANAQAAYWSDIAPTAIHTSQGAAMLCDERYESTKKATSLEHMVIDLIVNEGRKGIAVFRPGIKEIESTVDELKALAKQAGITNLEIASIYSGTPPDERTHATAPPAAGKVKILVGTNVIESGVNLRWLDAGVSDGKGRVPYDREDTGAYVLKLEDLPQWRIIQQRGRINRDAAATGFDSGIFLLHSEQKMEHRPQQASAEIERIALTNLAFRAASLGINPTTLKLDAQISPTRMEEAKTALLRLQLIHEDWSLTTDGKYAAKLPVSPEAGALLCEARRLDAPLLAARKPAQFLPDAIMLAALLDSEGLRQNYKHPHAMDQTSDVIDALKIFQQLISSTNAKIVTSVTDETLASATPEYFATLKSARETMKKRCASANVNFNMFCDTAHMMAEIRSRHGEKELKTDESATLDNAHYNGLKQCLLNASVNTLFHNRGDATSADEGTFQDLLRNYGNKRNNAGQPFDAYALSDASAINIKHDMNQSPIMAGRLREIGNKMGEAKTIITNATSIPHEIFLRWAAVRSDVVLTELDQGKTSLDARYFDSAHFSVPLGKATPELTANLKTITTKKSKSANTSDSWTSRTSAIQNPPQRGA